MKKSVFIMMLTCLFGIGSYAQDMIKELRSEADGNKWYYVHTEDHSANGASAIDGKTIVPMMKCQGYPNTFYSITYAKGNATDSRMPFLIVSRLKKNGNTYSYEGSSVYDFNGNNVIPFSRGYTYITYCGFNGPAYFQVDKGNYGKTGACDIGGNEVVSPQYNSVVYMADGFSVDRGVNNWSKTGVVLNSNGLADNKAFSKKRQEDCGFIWYETYQDGKYGAEDGNGNTIIPLSRGYTDIMFYTINDKPGYFLCDKGSYKGACNLKGEEIVKPIYKHLSYYETGFFGRKDGEEYNDLNIYLENHNSLYIPRSAEVKKIWLEHNVTQNGEKGMTIHAYITLAGMKKKKFEAIVYFYDENKRKLTGGVSGYKTSDGQVCTSEYGTPGYDNCKYEDFTIFIPLRALPLASGKHSYYCHVRVLDTEKDQFISKSSEYASFTGTGADNSNQNYYANSQRSASQQSSSNPMHRSSNSPNSWRETINSGNVTGYIDHTRNADGTVTAVTHTNCICYTGVCNVCGGTRGIHNYYFGTFTPCGSCGGTGRCKYCNGTKERVSSETYRPIDEYYINGVTVLHLNANRMTISVTSGGNGLIYSDGVAALKESGGNFVFGGATVYGFTQPTFKLSRDYSSLIMNGKAYQRTNKQTYDKQSAVIEKFNADAAAYGSGGGYSGSRSGSSSSNAKYEKLPSRHGDATCKGCGGSGRCTACGGAGNSIKEEYDSVLGHSVRTTSNCGVCRGTGNCGVCHGSGKIHY